MSKHTPGPYRINRRPNGEIRLESDIAVHSVATIHSNENTESNMRLFRASPELLDWAKTFLKTIDALDGAIKSRLADKTIQGSVFDLRAVRAELQRTIKQAEGK